MKANFDDYIEVETLKEVYNSINEICSVNNYNLCYKFRISSENLENDNSFPEKDVDAELWLNKDRPSNFIFNHGEKIYNFDGINHVKKELKNKITSKRALFIVPSQQEITNSGDIPIPSFILAQYSNYKSAIFVTHYYRALETYHFLKINLNELKMLIQEISAGDQTDVFVTMFAFLAYEDKNSTPLEKYEIDTLTQPSILKKLQKGGADLESLFSDLKKSRTFVEFKGIDSILEWLNSEKSIPQGLNEKVKEDYFLEKINELRIEFLKLEDVYKKGKSERTIKTARNRRDKIIDEIIEHITH